MLKCSLFVFEKKAKNAAKTFASFCRARVVREIERVAMSPRDAAAFLRCNARRAQIICNLDTRSYDASRAAWVFGRSLQCNKRANQSKKSCGLSPVYLSIKFDWQNQQMISAIKCKNIKAARSRLHKMRIFALRRLCGHRSVVRRRRLVRRRLRVAWRWLRWRKKRRRGRVRHRVRHRRRVVVQRQAAGRHTAKLFGQQSLAATHNNRHIII